MEKPILLLINLHSRRGLMQFGEVVASFNELGVQYVIGQVMSPGDFAKCIYRYHEKVSAVVIGGGDGTLNLAIDALLETGLPLGILPLGTANDLARTLQLPLDLAAACAVIAQGQRKAIDLGKVNGKYFFNVASCGLSIAVTEALSGDLKKRWGVLAYFIAALKGIARSRKFDVAISVDDGPREKRRTLQIAVGNGRFYGGGLAVVDDAAIDDRRLDLYSLEMPHWWHLFTVLPALKLGHQNENIGIVRWQGRKIEVMTRSKKRINTDGEVTTRTPAVFELCPAALEVFVVPPDQELVSNPSTARIA